MGEVEEFCVAGCQWASDSENLYVFAHLADMSLNDEIYPHGACGSVHVHPLISQISHAFVFTGRENTQRHGQTLCRKGIVPGRGRRVMFNKKNPKL